jgi:hypothetical protein
MGFGSDNSGSVKSAVGKMKIPGLSMPHATALKVGGMNLGSMMHVRAARQALKQMALGKGMDMDTSLWSSHPAEAPKSGLSA